jgi:hypothetical protein
MGTNTHNYYTKYMAYVNGQLFIMPNGWKKAGAWHGFMKIPKTMGRMRK